MEAAGGTSEATGELGIRVIRAGAPEILRRGSWMPDHLRGRVPEIDYLARRGLVEAWQPQTALGRSIREALPYLPEDLRAELVERATAIVVCESRLEARVRRRGGAVEDYGVISRRKVTVDGVVWVVNCMAATAGYSITTFRYHGLGTTNAPGEAQTDTALQAEITVGYTPDNTRATGTAVAAASGNNGTYTSVATNTISDVSVNAVEHGLFNNAAAGIRVAGTNLLFDRSVYAVINLAAGDSLQTTYVWTLASEA